MYRTIINGFCKLQQRCLLLCLSVIKSLNCVPTTIKSTFPNFRSNLIKSIFSAKQPNTLDFQFVDSKRTFLSVPRRPGVLVNEGSWVCDGRDGVEKSRTAKVQREVRLVERSAPAPVTFDGVECRMSKRSDFSSPGLGFKFSGSFSALTHLDLRQQMGT